MHNTALVMLLKLKKYNSLLLSCKKIKKRKKKRKRHVETMFLSSKTKRHTFYFKSTLKSSEFKRNVPIVRGSYNLRSLCSGYISISPFKSVARLIKLYSRKLQISDSINYKITKFPDFSLTNKPKDVRMGKGKGKNIRKFAYIRKNQIFLTLFSYNFEKNHYFCLYILRQLIRRLPMRFIITKNFW